MKRIIVLLLLIVSAFLVFCAPKTYSLTFCSICLCVFAYPAFTIVWKDIKEIGVVNFNSFFVFSFFLVSYAFPVFILPFYDIDSQLFPIINKTVINKCVALCTCAFLSYALGYCLRNKKNRRAFKTPYKSAIRGTKPIYYVLFSVVLITSAITLLTDITDIQVNIASYFVTLYIISAAIILYSQTSIHKYNGMLSLLEDNSWIFITMLLVAIIYVIIGDRGLVLQIGLLLIAIYSIRCKPIQLRMFLPLIFVGIFFMYSIRVTRTTNASLSRGNVESFITESRGVIEDNEFNIWMPFADLTERYVELYLGYEIQEKEGGYLYPLKIFSILAAPIPFLPDIVNKAIYDIPLSGTSIGKILGVYYGFHAGTHCVIATYAPWGLAGLIIVFFIFGYFTRRVTINFRINPYYGVIYFILISMSVYMPRSSVMDIYRPTIWTIMILYLWGFRTIRQKRVR